MRLPVPRNRLVGLTILGMVLTAGLGVALASPSLVLGEDPDPATDAGLDRVQTAVVRGTPHEVIGSYVDTNDVDVVVMGTHGRSGLDRYLLGSVAENVIRTSTIPVLAVRYGEAD